MGKLLRGNMVVRRVVWLEIKGGKGSGNWGHAGGRGGKGKPGGSRPRGEAMSLRTGQNWQQRQRMAKKAGDAATFDVVDWIGNGKERVDGELFGGGRIGIYWNARNGLWDTVHVQSGKQIDSFFGSFRNLESAREAGAALANSGIDWDSPDLMDKSGHAYYNKYLNPPQAQQEIINKVYGPIHARDNNRPKTPPAVNVKPMRINKPQGKKKVVETVTGVEVASGSPPAGDAANNKEAAGWFSKYIKPKKGKIKGELKQVADAIDANSYEIKKHKRVVVGDLSKRSGLPYDVVNEMVGSWASSSSDHHIESLEMQMAASRFLGTNSDKFLEKRLFEVKSTGATSKFSDEQRDTFIKAMYQHTQEQLGAAGFKPTDTVRVYRGVTNVFSGAGLNEGDTVKLNQNPMTSWSLSKTVAQRFADDNDLEHAGNAVLTMDVPISAIIGSARTGVGCLNEVEIVVANTGDHYAQVNSKYQIKAAGAVWVINIDADDVNADWIKWRSREAELEIHRQLVSQYESVTKSMTVSLVHRLEIKGGAGSGNWGHAGGRGGKDKPGGSRPRGEAMSRTSGRDWQQRQAAAKSGKGGGVSMIDKETGIDLNDPNALGSFNVQHRAKLEAGRRFARR